MAKAANAFLASLDTAKRAKASLSFNSEERLNWNFVPRERQGVPIKQMSAEQRRAALWREFKGDWGKACWPNTTEPPTTPNLPASRRAH